VRRKSLLTVLFGVVCCCFAATQDISHAATMQNATVRVRNIGPDGTIIGSVPEFTEDTARWYWTSSRVTVSPINTYGSKEATFRLANTTTANGTFTCQLVDKYGYVWTDNFTVRQGVTTYIYDLQRGFSIIKFVDQNGKPFAFSSLHLSTTPTGYSPSNALFGDKNGYEMPIVPDGYFLIGRWNGQTLPISVTAIGAANWWGEGQLQINVPQTTRSNNTTQSELKVEESEIKLEGKKMTAEKKLGKAMVYNDGKEVK